MIAKRIPREDEPTAGRPADIAPLFGLSLDEFNNARRAFLESEGFDGDGNEYENLFDWLTIPHNRRRDNTPFHKGDDHID